MALLDACLRPENYAYEREGNVYEPVSSLHKAKDPQKVER